VPQPFSFNLVCYRVLSLHYSDFRSLLLRVEVLGVRGQIMESPRPYARIPQNPQAGRYSKSLGIGIPHRPTSVRKK
jgi:hypothetical protein